MATITRVEPKLEESRLSVKVSLASGETSVPIRVPMECVVSATPGSGGTMLVQATFSSEADIGAGTATWHDWDAGTVSAKTNQMLVYAQAVRFTATTAAGVGEVSR